MKSIAIIYFSQTGSTDQMAQAIAAGAEQQGARILAHRIQGQEIVEGRFNNPALMEALADVDAIIFGSPTYMGGPAAQFKAFADASSESWSAQRWKDKLAAGFTVGGSPGGDVQHTIDCFQILASQHSMLWVGMDAPEGVSSPSFNRLSSSNGAIGLQNTDGGLDDIDIKTANRLGERIAELIR